MATATSSSTPYGTEVRCGELSLRANTLKEGVGGTDGFRPHELLEAAVAGCLNITVRMAAARAGKSMERVTTTVRLDRTGDGPVTFHYTLAFDGDLDDDEVAEISRAATQSPVLKTLSRGVRFEADGTSVGDR